MRAARGLTVWTAGVWAAALLAAPPATAQERAGHVMATDSMGVVWRMPPQPRPMPMMLPSLMGSIPGVTPFLPGADLDPTTLPEAVFRHIAVQYDRIEFLVSHSSAPGYAVTNRGTS